MDKPKTISIPLLKNCFNFKNDKNGLILTAHHTIKNDRGILRVRFINASFNEANNFLIAVDHRGNIFAFDLLGKEFWQLSERITVCTTVAYIPKQPTQFIFGNRNGKIAIIDVCTEEIINSKKFSDSSIKGVSFPTCLSATAEARAVQNFIVYTADESVLINLHTFDITHRLEHRAPKLIVKYISFIPRSEDIFACFRDDSVHIWCGNTLRTIRTLHPMRMLESHLKSRNPDELEVHFESSDSLDINLNIGEITRDFNNGNLSSFAFSSDGRLICLTTLDDHILILSSLTFDLVNVIKLKLISCRSVSFISEKMLFLLTTKSQVVLVDYANTATTFLLQSGRAYSMKISPNNKMLLVILDTGEVNVYNVASAIDALRKLQVTQKIVKESTTKKPIEGSKFGIISDELQKILSLKRLLPILNEYGEYPQKYRSVVWRFLLDLPSNRSAFVEIVKKGYHPNVNDYDQKYPLRNPSDLRNLKKIMSYLMYWSKICIYCEFLPGFVFPFLKVFPSSSLLSFELVLFVIWNYCQLWFEFAPLEPFNYLGIVENVLAHFDPDLLQFYKNQEIGPKMYAWPLMATAFSEILDESQWYQLWDHLVSNEPFLLIFCLVAYNIIQKPVIVKLKTKQSIGEFFHDQNIVDMRKLIRLACSMMENCPAAIHPKRYMQKVEPIPNGFYPKFENYPQEWVGLVDNEIETLQNEQKILNEKIQQLEVAEKCLMVRLEQELKQDEHERRMKEVEKLFEETLTQEEERVAYQRKLLLFHQKQVQQRKGKVLQLMKQSRNRRELDTRENELASLHWVLHRNHGREETEMQLASGEAKMLELDALLEQHKLDGSQSTKNTCQQRFRSKIEHLRNERQKLSNAFDNLKKEQSRNFQTDMRASDMVKNVDVIKEMLQQIEAELPYALKCEPNSNNSTENSTKGIKGVRCSTNTSSSGVGRKEFIMSGNGGGSNSNSNSAGSTYNLKELERKTNCLEKQAKRLLGKFR